MENSNCGIYAIINKVNGKMYIGSSRNLSNRKSQHFSDLRSNIHDNNYLQKAWNKYRSENFEFKILEYCKKEKLLEREDFYFYKYQSTNLNCGYNLSVKASKVRITTEGIERIRLYHLGKSPSNETREKIRKSLLGRKQSEETKRKQSIAHTGKKMSPEAIEKLRLRNLGNKYSLGKKRTPEQIEKTASKTRGLKRTPEQNERNRQAHLGKKASEETKEKLRQSGLKRKHSEETKKKISEANKGKLPSL